MLWTWGRRIVLAVLGAGAAGVLALWLEHRVSTELPAPTGTFAVGRTSYTWDDISAWMWYRCRDRSAADDYLPDGGARQLGTRAAGIHQFLHARSSRVRGAQRT